jgi:hypothetical protein
LQKWFGYHIEAAMRASSTHGDTRKKPWDEYHKAVADLDRRFDSEIWLISDQFQDRLIAMMTSLETRHDPKDWIGFLEDHHKIILDAGHDLRVIARNELSVKR